MRMVAQEGWNSVNGATQAYIAVIYVDSRAVPAVVKNLIISTKPQGELNWLRWEKVDKTLRERFELAFKKEFQLAEL